jgi:hypothetical protein
MKLRLLFSLFAILSMVGIQAQIATVGIIGTATPDDWNSDVDMVQDAVNPDLWTLDILLEDGEAKFRANDAWDLNWGDSDFPIGVGVANGPNIPVRAGQTHVTFNSATGEYYFSVASDIGILGSAAPFGWDSDVNMYQDTADENQYSLNLNLAAGEAKFRQNDAWDINWGASDFPSGVGVQNGPNIPIGMAGEYAIDFNKATGAYNFTLISFSTVGLIGDATSGGWDTPTPMTAGGTGDDWSVSVDLTDGGVQFSGENGLVVWGGSTFPSGTAEANGDTIPVPAGRYVVNFNSETLVYNFQAVVYYNTIGIIGDATPGGWNDDTDMERDPVDSSLWTLRLILNDGFAKFRANDAWDVNWGAGDFPTGTAIMGGADIPITAGEYNITFNTFTGFYRFQELLIYSSMGLIGPATPFGDWATDAPMEKDANDENLWKIQSIDLTTGEAKFRAEGAWTVNWGATDWPTGIGTQDGPNIPVTGGTYGVTLNSATGEYAFGDPLSSTKDVLNPSSIKAYPNPANEVLNLDLSAIELRGEVVLTVFDASGRVLLSEKQQGNSSMQLGVASLPDGYYTLHISNDEYIIGKKFAIAR